MDDFLKELEKLLRDYDAEIYTSDVFNSDEKVMCIDSPFGEIEIYSEELTADNIKEYLEK